MTKYVISYSYKESTQSGTIIYFNEAEVIAPSIAIARDELMRYLAANDIKDTTIYSFIQTHDGPGVYSDKFIYSKTKLNEEA